MASIQSFRGTALELGIKDQERYIDMTSTPAIPLYFATHRDKYLTVREELSFSPYTLSA